MHYNWKNICVLHFGIKPIFFQPNTPSKNSTTPLYAPTSTVLRCSNTKTMLWFLQLSLLVRTVNKLFPEWRIMPRVRLSTGTVTESYNKASNRMQNNSYPSCYKPSQFISLEYWNRRYAITSIELTLNVSYYNNGTNLNRTIGISKCDSFVIRACRKVRLFWTVWNKKNGVTNKNTE